MRILAVDDDADFLAILRMVMEGLGYTDLVTAESGPEAIERIEDPDETFDLFILDVQMPDMNGIELTRRIREQAEYRETPIMMNTAIADREHIDGAFAAGATDYLTKPVDAVEIKARLGVIEQLIDQRRRAQAASVPPEQPGQPGPSPVTTPSYGFMDGIPLKRVEGAIDLFTMGNYLKSLGMFRALTVAAVGIRVTNARAIHDLEGGHVFGEVMIDVATCIADCFNTSNHMIAYAGGGVFVCLLPKSELEDPDGLADRLREYILEFEHVYAELDIQLPTIAVGPPISVRAAQLGSPTRIIDEAIETVKPREMHAVTTA